MCIAFLCLYDDVEDGERERERDKSRSSTWNSDSIGNLSGRYSAIVAFNRDEFLERETRCPHWWKEEGTEGSKQIYGGRDLRAGGSWMGVTRCGRIAFLTNVREKDPVEEKEKEKEEDDDDWGKKNQSAEDLPEILRRRQQQQTPSTSCQSRGLLIKNYLVSETAPEEYCKEVVSNSSERYRGYNLFVGKLGGQGKNPDFAHVSNRGMKSEGGVQVMRSGGVWGISNGPLGSWWKVRKGCEKIKRDLPAALEERVKMKMKKAVTGQVLSDWIFDNVLMDGERAPEDQVPETGLGLDIELPNSSIYVEPFEREAWGKFGTRSSTVILFDKVDKKVLWYERTFEGSKAKFSQQAEVFSVE